MNMVVDPVTGAMGFIIVIIGLLLFVIISDHNNKNDGDGGSPA